MKGGEGEKKKSRKRKFRPLFRTIFRENQMTQVTDMRTRTFYCIYFSCDTVLVYKNASSTEESVR